MLDNITGAKQIAGYPNYLITPDGKVISKKTYTILKPDINHHKYYKVRLYHNGRGRWELVHRLVAYHFIADEYEKFAFGLFEVHHKDKNILNNHKNNLKILTQIRHLAEHLDLEPINDFEK